MALDDGLKRERRSLVVPRHKLLQELRIGHPTDRSQTEEPVELPPSVVWFLLHDCSLETPGPIRLVTSYCPITGVASRELRHFQRNGGDLRRAGDVNEQLGDEAGL